MPKHFEKVIELISDENLAKIVNSISNDKLATIIDHASDENLKRIADSISISGQNLYLLPAEKIKQIMILIHGEEVIEQLEKEQLLEEIINIAESELDEIKAAKLLELIGDIPNENLERIMSNISNDKLATIIDRASDESLIRIVDSIPDQNFSKVLSEISSLLSEEKFKQIMVLICGEEVVEQHEKQGEEQYKSSNEEYHENFVNSGSSVGLLGNSEKTGYNSDDSGPSD